jgi:beta-aspartyl-peptidase (threonine type)
MKLSVLAICLALVFCTVLMSAQPFVANGRSGPTKISKREAKQLREVRLVLDTQVASWNRGDLEGFMQTYWHSPELTFNSVTNRTTGWEATFDRYKKKYQSDGKEMGTLRLDELNILILGRDAAFVRGRWRLTLKESSPGGLFTLILRRLPEGWRIIHDHTS